MFAPTFGPIGENRSSSPIQVELPLDALPRLHDARAPIDANHGKFTLTARSGGYRLFVAEDLLAEVEVGGFRAFTRSRSSESLEFAGAGGPGGSIFECGPGRAAPSKGDQRATDPFPRITERGIHVRGWTGASASYVEYGGTLNIASCRGQATYARVATARALWPGVLYAFVSADAEGNLASLHVLGPSAAWVSAGPTPPGEELRPHVGTFSHVVVALDSGSAAIAMSLTDSELGRFRALRIGGSAPAMSDAKPTVRVIVDVERQGPAVGVLRMTAHPLASSSVVQSLLASLATPAAGSGERAAKPRGAGDAKPTPRPGASGKPQRSPT